MENHTLIIALTANILLLLIIVLYHMWCKRQQASAFCGHVPWRWPGYDDMAKMMPPRQTAGF